METHRCPVVGSEVDVVRRESGEARCTDPRRGVPEQNT